MSRKFKDNLTKIFIYLSIGITCVVLFWIVGFVIIKGVGSISPEFLLSRAKGGDEGGILPMIVNTIFIVVLTISIATPIGVFSAIYLTEYAKPGKLLKSIRFTTECLSGIPSIIFGLFGMLFFVIFLKLKFSILSGALTLSMMVLPTIIRTTEETLKNVPKEYKEGSLALGASRLRTIFKIILPNSLPGIFTSIILSMGRIVGETAAVIFTAGLGKEIIDSVMESGATLSVHLYILAKEGINFEKAYGTALVLLVIVGVLNILASILSKKLNKANY